MMNRFELDIEEHHTMYCFRGEGMTLEERRLLRGIVTNQWSDSDDYRLARNAHPFLQGYSEPSSYGRGRDGWALVEFWTDDFDACQAFVDHVNAAFAKAFPPAEHDYWPMSIGESAAEHGFSSRGTGSTRTILEGL